MMVNVIGGEQHERFTTRSVVSWCIPELYTGIERQRRKKQRVKAAMTGFDKLKRMNQE